MPTRYPFPAVPDGWFSIAASDDIGVGTVTTLRYLDRELVAFRGDDGRARVFDAHCPHLGAHFGFGGKVCGDGIVCPFHGWHFDGDGRLVEVPRLERQPPPVSARAWDVRERNGRVFVWHHAGGAPPSFEVAGYREDGADWTPWRVDTYRVRIHLQDLTENIIDRSHFTTVHDMVPPEDDHFEVTFDGPLMVVDQSIRVTAVSESGVEVQTRTTVCGPGVVAVEVREGPLDMLTYITQSPVDEEITEVTIHFSMKALDDERATASVADLNAQVTNLQFTQDVPIWEHKVYRERPPLTKLDGPIAQYRRWFRQFYSGWEPSDRDPRARAAPVGEADQETRVPTS
ncbi:MAG TPA: Rieske 2Fe-2S domain-containing protein [Acidimicrobiales bacterium]|nr:Rieske 2Fe-2S domain-containing protein [Acidimicrobiales bacterium]